MRAEALILAAGRGSRLRPHTDSLPKCLLPFAGRRLIDWQAAALAEAGIKKLAVATGYRAEAFEGLPWRRFHNPRWAQSNMVASLLSARPLLEQPGDLVIGYGDIVYEPEVARALLATPGDIVVAVHEGWLAYWQARFGDPLSDAESLRLDGEGRISDIGRRPRSLQEIEGQYIGLMLFREAGLRRLLAFCDGGAGGLDLERCYMTDLLRGLIGDGAVLQACRFPRGWLEFDSGDDLALYERLAGEGRLDPFFRPWL